jgi:hypothetical protein
MTGNKFCNIFGTAPLAFSTLQSHSRVARNFTDMETVPSFVSRNLKWACLPNMWHCETELRLLLGGISLDWLRDSVQLGSKRGFILGKRRPNYFGAWQSNSCSELEHMQTFLFFCLVFCLSHLFMPKVLSYALQCFYGERPHQNSSCGYGWLSISVCQTGVRFCWTRNKKEPQMIQRSIRAFVVNDKMHNGIHFRVV